MKVLVLAVLIVADLVYNPPGWVPCSQLEEGSWRWWFQGCFMASTAASSLTSWLLPAALVGAMSFSLRQPRVK
jgi:hypothetical protein